MRYIIVMMPQVGGLMERNRSDNWLELFKWKTACPDHAGDVRKTGPKVMQDRLLSAF